MDTQREGFLKDEYLFLQNNYEDFDRRVLTIKSWAVTLSLGAFAAGFQYKAVALWFLGSLSAILFWLVEATWKTFQYANGPRIEEIEKYFAGKINYDMYPFQARRSWFEEWRKVPPVRRICRNTRLFIIAIPYLPIFVGGVFLLCFHYLVRPFWGR